MAVWSEVKFRTVANSDRLDAEFYKPEYLAAEAQLLALGSKRADFYIEDIRYGLNVPPDYTEQGLDFIRALNLKEYGIEGEVLRIPYSPQEVGQINLLKMGDIVVVRSGANVGDVGVTLEPLVGATFGSYVIRIRAKKINSFYLYVFLKCLYGRFQTVRYRSGAAQPNISIPNIRDILVYEPSEDFQLEIAGLLFKSQETIRQSKNIYAEAETLLLNALGVHNLSATHTIAYKGNFQEVARAGRFDAQYYHPEKYEVLEALRPMSGENIGSLFTSINQIVDAENDFASEVQNYDLTDALRFFLPDIALMPTAELGSNKKRFSRGDVVVSRLRSYLKEIAIVEASSPACVGSTEFFVLRPRSERVSSELLLVYLRSEPVQKILRWCQDGSQHPRFKEIELLSIKLPDRLLTIQNKVIAKVREAIKTFYEAQNLLETAKRRVEELIEEGA